MDRSIKQRVLQIVDGQVLNKKIKDIDQGLK